MAIVETCKCEECGIQKSTVNHWVMVVERKASLLVLPAWDAKKIRRTRHFCGPAHASRFVERWIASPGMRMLPTIPGEAVSWISASPCLVGQSEVQQRQMEQKLMEDEYGDELSSARLI